MMSSEKSVHESTIVACSVKMKNTDVEIPRHSFFFLGFLSITITDKY